MPLIFATTLAYFPRRTFFAPLLAVAAVRADVPDCEDVPWVSDADLDVCLFIDPAPLPDTLDLRRGDVHRPGGVDGFPGVGDFLVEKVENRAIEVPVVPAVFRDRDVRRPLRHGGGVEVLEGFHVRRVEQVEAVPQA